MGVDRTTIGSIKLLKLFKTVGRQSHSRMRYKFKVCQNEKSYKEKVVVTSQKETIFGGFCIFLGCFGGWLGPPGVGLGQNEEK